MGSAEKLQREVFKQVSERGLPEVLAVALIANSLQESSTSDPSERQDKRQTELSDGDYLGQDIDPKIGRGYGVFQLDNDSRKIYKLYAETVGKPYDSIETQVSYVLDDMQRKLPKGMMQEYDPTRFNEFDRSQIGTVGNKNLVAFMGSASQEDAVKYVSNNYLMPGTPHLDKRLANLSRVNKDFSIKPARVDLTGDGEESYSMMDRAVDDVNVYNPNQTSEPEQVKEEFESIKKMLKDGGNGNPPVAFDSLTEPQQRATLTYLYQEGPEQPNFIKSLSKLAYASENPTIESMDELAEMTAGFMDVKKVSASNADLLTKAALGRQNTFLHQDLGKLVDDSTAATRSEVVRDRAQASLMKMQNIKARQEITSGMSYKGNVVL